MKAIDAVDTTKEDERRGPGAPRQFGEPTVRTSAYLPQSIRDGIAAVGEGNFSAGIRKIYAVFMQGDPVF